MRYNGLGKDGGEALLHALMKEHPSITTFCTIPIQALKDNSITELDLSKKGLGVGEAIILSYYIRNNRALTTLNISNNSLGGHRDEWGRWISDMTGIKALAAAIPECK